MTSTITLLCPKGIVLATDTRETIRDKYTGDIIKHRDGVQKIYQVKHNTNVGISCWGLAEVVSQGQSKKDIVPYLEEFDSSVVEEGDTVDTIAEKLKEKLEGVTPRIDDRMGFHVAGYINSDDHKVPHLNHVFHWNWHGPGEFTNEDCHVEYHLPNGNKVLYKVRKEYPPLFNGDNLVANALFNYAPNIQPYYSIVPHLLSLKDCIELAELVVSTSIQRLNYFFDLTQFQKIPPIVGGGVRIATITESNGFEWIL